MQILNNNPQGGLPTYLDLQLAMDVQQPRTHHSESGLKVEWVGPTYTIAKGVDWMWPLPTQPMDATCLSGTCNQHGKCLQAIVFYSINDYSRAVDGSPQGKLFWTTPLPWTTRFKDGGSINKIRRYRVCASHKEKAKKDIVNLSKHSSSLHSHLMHFTN